MNILFLTLGNLDNFNRQGIYTDLLKEFRNNGHDVYAVCALERKKNKNTYIKCDSDINVLHVKTGNITQCSFIEKGISTLRIENQFISAIKKYYANIKFDVVIYSTPPITFYKAIKYVKKRDSALSYLLLKDIFPQNAIDLGILSLKSPIYRFFRNKEKKLYELSDCIGCMSPKNKEYILNHNDIKPESKIDIAPNSIKAEIKSISLEEKRALREKYHIPINKRIFVYGGNLGKPQGVDFVLQCLKATKYDENKYFLIIGGGTETARLKKIINIEKIENVSVRDPLPKEEYETLVKCCDVGMIFLDYRFTIPNFPSRLLSYMQAGIPVLSCTDPNTDVGEYIEQNKIGFQCLSNDIMSFVSALDKFSNEEENLAMGERAQRCLKKDFDVKETYIAMINQIMERENV